MREGREELHVELSGIELGREGHPILAGVSLRLAGGTTALLMGGSGSGKTSLLKVAAGILLPDRGEAFFEGRALSSFTRSEHLAFHRRSGFVFQDAALWSNQTLYENIAFPLRFHEPASSAAEVEVAVRRAADRAGCPNNLRLRPAEVSGGERRLVGLARALVLDPELLFLDEPTAGLDEEEGARVIELIADMRRRGRTILAASSSSDLAYGAADEIGVLREGRLLVWGSYDEAVLWTEPALRSAAGRLRPRRNSGGLLGEWEDAMTGSGPDEGKPGRME